MPPSRPKKPLPPEEIGAVRRAAAVGVAEGLGRDLPAEDSGLGPVGEKALIGLLDEVDRDEEQHKTLMRFTPRWRAFIRRQDATRLDAADELIDEALERKAMRRFWLRIGKLACFVGPVVFGWASGFFEKVLPLIQQIMKAIQGHTP